MHGHTRVSRWSKYWETYICEMMRIRWINWMPGEGECGHFLLYVYLYDELVEWCFIWVAFLVGLLTRNVSGEDKSRIAKGDGFVMGGWSYIYGLAKDGQGWDENLGFMEWVIQIQHIWLITITLRKFKLYIFGLLIIYWIYLFWNFYWLALVKARFCKIIFSRSTSKG